MPPKKRTTKAATADDGPTAASVAVLLARCPRAALESILEEAVASGAVTYARIQQELPESKHSSAIVRPTVTHGQTRDGTGWFDLLDDELLVAIFSSITSTPTLLDCAIAGVRRSVSIPGPPAYHAMSP